MTNCIDPRSFYPQPIIGVDEAGRGCLAGPVFAGAVILNTPQKFKDSKLLTPKARELCAKEIKKNHLFAIGIATVKEIEILNIHHASLLAMKRAVKALKISRAHVLIDGLFCLKGLDFLKQTAIVQGDKKISAIAAAGILAKTERDKLFLTYDKQYPKYFFKQHKGYGTKLHKEAIKKQGICPIHRVSFSGVKDQI